MTTAFTNVYSAALELTDLERSELTARLLAQLEPETWTDDAWEKELQERVDEIQSGKAKMVPWENVREMMRNEINGPHS